MNKRQAGDQITKDRTEEDDWGRDTPPDPAEDASAEVLATRKIALPKSRLKGRNAAGSESPRPNPFAMGDAAQPKATINPFASLGTSTASTPFGSTSTKTQNAFSFGTKPKEPVDSSEDSQSVTQKDDTQNNAPQASKNDANDAQFDELLKLRSINVAFQNAIRDCLANNAFADLTSICEEYKTHRNSTQAVPIAAKKNTEGTNIYPSFTSNNSNGNQESKPSSEAATPISAAPPADTSAPKFSFNPAAPTFSFNSSANTATKPSFTFGTPASNSDDASKSASGAPSFTFGQPASTTDGSDKKESEDKTDDAKEVAASTSKKSSDNSSKDFSWTPDRGIKFGDAAKTTESKPAAPTFTFNNPLASPNQSTNPDSTPPKPVFSFGNTGTTGFSFGQAASESKAETKSDDSAAKAPAFNFASGTPAFSFGQSTAPTFSFQAPRPAAAPAADKESTPAAQEDDADGDAMPEEPRTNDALIAGPGVGEEDEDEVYNVPRAKLFKYDSSPEASNPWIDLGICVIRVLVHKETKKARIIARAEGAGALRLNARMYPHFKYTQEGKSNVKVYEMTAAQKNETFLIKIKDPAISAELTKVLNEKKG